MGYVLTNPSSSLPLKEIVDVMHHNKFGPFGSQFLVLQFKVYDLVAMSFDNIFFKCRRHLRFHWVCRLNQCKANAKCLLRLLAANASCKCLQQSKCNLQMLAANQIQPVNGCNKANATCKMQVANACSKANATLRVLGDALAIDLDASTFDPYG
ncbi:hypothetical protein Tco_0213142 [Tanacetum coccineum]